MNTNCVIVEIDNYLASLRNLKYSPRSIQAFKIALNKFTLFLETNNIKRLQDVSLDTLDAYRLLLVKEELTGQSIHFYLRSVRKFFAFLENAGSVFINPAANMRIPRPDRLLQPIPSQEEMIILLQQPDTATPAGIRDRALIETLYSTGVRLEELVQMKIKDIDTKQKTVRVIGKGSKERIVPIGSKALESIAQYIKDVRPRFAAKAKQARKINPNERFLWLGEQGRRMNILIIGRAIKAYGEKAGIDCPVTPHSIRRACATHLLQNNAHPIMLQLMLGHNSLNSLSQYLRVAITDLKTMHSKGRPGR